MKIARALLIPAILTAIVVVCVAILFTLNPWALICTAICALGTFAVIVDFGRTSAARRRSTGENIVVASVRLIDKDHRRYGGQLSHLGIMLLVLGVAGSSLFKVEETHQLKPGDSVMVDGNQLTFLRLDEKRETNYTAIMAIVALTDREGLTYTLNPQRRFYDTWADQPNSEVSILTTWKEDVYVSLAGWENNGAITAIQIRVNPLVVWIWIGGIVMILGSGFCILPRLLPQAKPVANRSVVKTGESEDDRSASAPLVSTSMKVEASS